MACDQGWAAQVRPFCTFASCWNWCAYLEQGRASAEPDGRRLGACPPLPRAFSPSPSPPNQSSRRHSQERIDLSCPRALKMDADTKRNIIWKLFFFDDEPPFPTDISLGDYDGYFTLFEDQTRNCDSGDVLAAIAIMKSDITVTRNDVWQKLQESRNLPPTPEILHDAIDGAVRVWLMINSRRTGEITMADLSVARTWPAAQKLCDFLYGIFYPGGSPPVPPATHYSAEELSDMAKESAEVQTRLTHPLTAVNLSRYPKIHIHWTSYISEHLQFEHNFKDLIVFEQKAWLTATVRLLKEWERRRDAAAKAARDAAAKAAQDAAAKAARDAPANAPAGGEFPL